MNLLFTLLIMKEHHATTWHPSLLTVRAVFTRPARQEIRLLAPGTGPVHAYPGPRGLRASWALPSTFAAFISLAYEGPGSAPRLRSASSAGRLGWRCRPPDVGAGLPGWWAVLGEGRPGGGGAAEGSLVGA